MSPLTLTNVSPSSVTPDDHDGEPMKPLTISPTVASEHASNTGHT
jgi:hypothetical protein